MGAGDEVQQEQRVEGAEPQGPLRWHAEPGGQARQARHDEGDAGEGDEPHRPDAEDGVFAGQGEDRRRAAQEDRAVGRGGVLPDRRHVQGEGAAEGGRAPPVRVEPAADHLTLGEVAVDVAAEHGGGHREGSGPAQQGSDQVGGALAVDGRAHPQPRAAQQGQPEVRAGDADEGEGAQLADEGPMLERVALWQRARGNATHRDRDGTREAQGTVDDVRSSHSGTLA